MLAVTGMARVGPWTPGHRWAAPVGAVGPKSLLDLETHVRDATQENFTGEVIAPWTQSAIGVRVGDTAVVTAGHPPPRTQEREVAE